MFRGLGSGVGIQGVGDGGGGAGLLDGAWMGFLRAGRMGRESDLGVGSVCGTFLMLDWVGRLDWDVLLSSVFLGFGCWDLREW